MVVTPGVRALTIPVLPTVATAVALLLQVPPPVASDSVVVAPAHTAAVPIIAAGVEITVTVVVAVQPESDR
jgi:hypothetical protein